MFDLQKNSGLSPVPNARRVIGYAPEDDNQVNIADRIAEIARE